MTNRLLAELIGTAFLLIGIVGSGIMAVNLSPDNTGVAFLANVVASGSILYVLITVLGPVSGAHLNPVITLVFALRREITPRAALAYAATQVAGGVLGVAIAHLMFDLPVLQFSATLRTGPAQWTAEVVASFGLIFFILGGLRHRPEAVPVIVAVYLSGASWFTSSKSFANPAVTIARSFTDSFTGIAPAHMPLFIAMQLLGAMLAMAVSVRLFGSD